jgi:hypothetical protein
MAIGFPAYFSESRTYQFQQHELAMVLRSTFDELGWQYENQPGDVFTAKVSMNAMSWGEFLRVEISSRGQVEVESKCAFPMQCIDWGKNKRNVKTFFSRFESLLKTELAN